jgi:hypothetical protein
MGIEPHRLAYQCVKQIQLSGGNVTIGCGIGKLFARM